ncbi:hypothetical protein LPB86_08780 [Pedobacter sp. MC2016-14]|uniref:hypothetical protein n=1 Tax=Pedobacter sp. MC2016-14 TaxID=2897327 RepID=UPI001E5A18A8|nr:hypothetical protein [Pedobacter sp. MC2016-14]MCD0488322.1 hypothetical protein [Pedobacter sp. MC2016-14]
MKKLFFAAALAIVAVGGAISVNAETFYSANGSQRYVCNGGAVSCASQIGSTPVYLINAPEGQQGPAVNPSEYEDLLFTSN